MNYAGVIREAGNSVENNKEGLRLRKPRIVDNCNNAIIFCPDGALFLDGKNGLRVDYSFCKGCGICAKLCPRNIDLVVEEK